jgi:hypothetical protein
VLFCILVKICFILYLEIFAEEIYRSVNCILRYSTSKIIKTKGKYFHFRVSQTLPHNLYKEVFNATLDFIKENNDFTVIESALKPFQIFRKGMDVESSLPNLRKMFSLSCLQDHLQDIEWDSNVLDVHWTPDAVEIPGEAEPLALRVRENFVLKAPYRLRKWLAKVIQPHKDPMAFLIFLLKRLRFGFLNIDFILVDFNFAIFSCLTPRY